MPNNDELNDDSSCPKCGAELLYRSCSGLGCEDGEYLDEDGINGDSYQRCDECNGKGYEEWCCECGWDNVFQRFLSPAYEQEWLAKKETRLQGETVFTIKERWNKR